MKKFSAILLALILVLAMTATAFAASITITPPATTGTSTGETYKAYKIFDATISGENVAYTIDDSNPFYNTIVASGYFTLTPTGDNAHVYIVVKNDNYNEAAAKTLSEQLKAAIMDATPVAGTSTKQDDGTYKISNLETGYYLVTSTVGSALILDTLKDEDIESKNEYPDLEKKVDKATANMGDTVTYTIDVKIPATAVGEIVVHDKMTGLSYTGMTTVEGITASTETGDVCAVHFTLSADYVAANRGKTVTITYTAVVTADTAKNEAYLVDDNFTSKTETVETKNYKVSVFKYTASGENKTGLAGAGFVLKNADGKYYKYTAATEMAPAKVEWVDDIDDATEYTTRADNNYTVTFEGLANGVYTIVEKTVPAGYNPLATDPTATINDANTSVEVENKTGSELPSTGGMGTTIFYVVGGLMMAAAVVILVAKKKVAAEK